MGPGELPRPLNRGRLSTSRLIPNSREFFFLHTAHGCWIPFHRFHSRKRNPSCHWEASGALADMKSHLDLIPVSFR